MSYSTDRMNEVRLGKKHVLTTKQLKYMAARLQGKTKEDAKREAGYSENSSTKTIEETNGVQGTLKTALEKVGLTDQIIADKLRKGLSTQKTHLVSFEGKFTDEKKTDDNDIQHRYMRTILEVRGDLQSGNNMQLNLGLIGLQAGENVDTWNTEPEKKTA